MKLVIRSCLFSIWLLLLHWLPLLQAQNCPIPFSLGNDTTLCGGMSLQLQLPAFTEDVLTIDWLPAAALAIAPNQLSATVSPTTPTTYQVNVRSLSGPQLVLNGNFEAGNSGFTSAYTNWTGSGNMSEGRYRITNNPQSIHSGFANCQDNSGGGDMMVVNAASTPVNIWCQTINVLPNETYAFSAAITSVVAQNPAILRFRVNGQLIGNNFTAPAVNCSWANFFALWESGANTTAQVCINNQNTAQSGNDFAIDDISFRRTCLSSASITVSPLESPVFNLVDAPTFCSSSDSIPLASLVAEGDTSGQFTLNGISLQDDWLRPAQLTAGSYLLTYTLGQAPCATTQSVTILVEAARSAGSYGSQPDDNFALCSSDLLTFNEHLNNGFDGDPGGSWSISGGLVPASISPTGQITWPSAAVGTYTIQYTLAATTNCPADLSSFTLRVDTLPAVNLGEDRSLNCDDSNFLLSNLASSATNYSYAWSRDGIPLTQGSQLLVNTPGLYVLRAINSQNGCEGSDTLIIRQLNTLPSLSFELRTPTCASMNRLVLGSVQVLTVTNASPPLLFSLNEGAFVADSSFIDLAPGRYQLRMEDAAGCSVDTSFQLTDPLAYGFQLSVRGDTAATLGIPFSVGISSNLPDAWLDSLRWLPDGIAEIGSRSILIRPEQPQVYQATVLTTDNCLFSDALTVRPLLPDLLYAPTAFSPNGDGNNDRWLPLTHPAVVVLEELLIFDRWGNQVFQSSELTPNDQSAGWDGRRAEKPLAKGLFAWRCRLRTADGQQLSYSGELLLLR